MSELRTDETLESLLKTGTCPACGDEGKLLTWERRDPKTDALLDRERKCLGCWRGKKN